MVDPVKEMRKNGKYSNQISPLETRDLFRSKCSRVEENASTQVSRGAGESQRDTTKPALVERQVEQSYDSHEIWLVICPFLLFSCFPPTVTDNISFMFIF